MNLQAAFFQLLDQQFDFAFLGFVDDQDAVAILHNDQIVDAEGRDDLLRIADDDAVASFDADVLGKDRVAVRVVRMKPAPSPASCRYRPTGIARPSPAHSCTFP